MDSTLMPIENPGLGMPYDASHVIYGRKPMLGGWPDLNWFAAPLVAGAPSRAW